jgi:hypothetical protein
MTKANSWCISNYIHECQLNKEYRKWKMPVEWPTKHVKLRKKNLFFISLAFVHREEKIKQENGKNAK